ncbi:ribonuclease P protein subunit p40-like [Dendronephthya gigantea]|uniref:ribonuclease P protein subunit p40-like n=1 Tax=Dendronephthya gigantea TaxID=151771 RepID=UPI0010699D79|nr:ribonuclease P protein subunit p40-like [Dendronephthya gigantea]
MAAKLLEYSPKRRMIFDKFCGKEGEEKCLKVISKHHFNISVGVLVPSFSTEKLHECISKLLFTDFSCLAEVSLTEIINAEFISKFVRPGSICALSHGTKIDTSDCAALLPTGILHLSLTKDSYESLGIQGKPSAFNNNLRFDIEINLLAPYFKPNKKYFERVSRGFFRTGLKFKFLFSMKAECKDTCEQKLDSYFISLGISCKTFECKKEVKAFLEVNIPIISFNNEAFLEIDSQCNAMDFHEWLGSLVCGVDCSKAASDSFVNTLSCPAPNQPDKAAYHKWTGFINSSAVCNLIKSAREILDRNPELPWFSIMIWGFSDTPVSWQDHCHGYFLCGDNHSTVIMFQKEQMWMYRMLGEHDEQP